MVILTNKKIKYVKNVSVIKLKKRNKRLCLIPNKKDNTNRINTNKVKKYYKLIIFRTK